jgi:hypothetical protein
MASPADEAGSRTVTPRADSMGAGWEADSTVEADLAAVSVAIGKSVFRDGLFARRATFLLNGRPAETPAQGTHEFPIRTN